MYFSHVLPAVRPRWLLYALEQVSVPFGLDWNRLPHRYSSVEPVHPSESDCSEAPLCFILICFLWIYEREKERFPRFLLNFTALTILSLPLSAVCELPCANGGRCVGPNICQCPSDYSGPQCLLRE